MRILTRQEFLKLPAGVLFQKGQPWYWDTPALKGETILDDEGKAIDFHYTDIFECAWTGAPTDFWEEMLKTGKEVPQELCGSRDGCFDDEDIFMVYSTEDRHALGKIMLGNFT